MRSRNTLTLFLMISSVVLLVALQFLWLRSSYEKAFFDFRRESSMLLRSTVFNLRDSLFVKNIEPVSETETMPVSLDSIRIKTLNGTRILVDTLKLKEHSKVQVFVSASGTSSDVNYLKPLASTLQRFEGKRSFIIRIGPDSLSIDTLSQHYRNALDESRLKTGFTIVHSLLAEHAFRERRTMAHEDSGDDDLHPAHTTPFNDTLFTDRVRLNPLHVYSAYFPDIRASVLKEITPQVVFSCFLTFTIVASFVIAFRNLRAQQRLNDLKNDFISNVTHELKTPVATVSVALEALRDFNALNNPERTKEYLNIAQNELTRLSLMTDKILSASTFETQSVFFIPEQVNLHFLVQEVLGSMKLVFEKRAIIVSYNPIGTDFFIRGSVIHLTNVVYNLVDNALKYSPDRSTIDISLSDAGGFLEFLIRDQGIGIAREFHKKIFEKLFRVPTGDVHRIKGYGLGLNYVSSVVKSHGGKISVDSEEGKGSLFKITIPRQVT